MANSLKYLKKISKKISKKFSRKKHLSNKQIAKIVLLASSLPAQDYLNSTNRINYEIVSNSVLNDALIDTFYQSKLNSFTVKPNSFNIVINETDLKELIGSHSVNIKELAQLTNWTPEQIARNMSDYFQSRKIFPQPSGMNGFVTKVSNTYFLTNAGIQTFLSTRDSHLSGVTGLTFLNSRPALMIFIPLVGGVFFASLERVTANTTLQPVMRVARDLCLAPPKFAEIAYNEIFVGPLLRMVGIDAPLNVTAMLQFGHGTKVIWGRALNTTLAQVAKSLPNYVYSQYLP